MGCIFATYEIVSEDSAKDGEVEESGFISDIDPNALPSTDNVSEAIELLRGCEASSSAFHVGVWYTKYGEMDFITGNVMNISYHLNQSSSLPLHLQKREWSEEEERAIYDAVTKA